MISDVTGGNMEQAFWTLWKLATPVLAVAVVLLLIERRQQERRADGLEQELANSNQKRANLVRKLAEAQIQANEAQALANILRHRDAATCPCSEVKAGREEIARLRDRNEELTLSALVDGVKYIKISRN